MKQQDIIPPTLLSPDVYRILLYLHNSCHHYLSNHCHINTVIIFHVQVIGSLGWLDGITIK